MIHLLAYALEAVADVLMLMSEPLGQLLGMFITLGTLVSIFLYVPRVIRNMTHR
jgi:hypothetical protein